jgi:hypothetical protein
MVETSGNISNHFPAPLGTTHLFKSKATDNHILKTTLVD